MPLKEYGSSLSPEALDALQVAFDEAWEKLRRQRRAKIDEQSARDLLARRIVEAAVERGERDPERLSRYALEAFSARERADGGQEPPGQAG